jgi:hypothetical protein
MNPSTLALSTDSILGIGMLICLVAVMLAS